jgi:hypothetical protein
MTKTEERLAKIKTALRDARSQVLKRPIANMPGAEIVERLYIENLADAIDGILEIVSEMQKEKIIR